MAGNAPIVGYFDEAIAVIRPKMDVSMQPSEQPYTVSTP
jgi:hypothetical protein